MRILEGEKVTKYFGGLTAVHSVDFTIDQGEIVGLIGPNGAGKTTLFNLISGALPTTIGEIRYKDRKITSLKPNQICKRGIARTFQLVKLFGNMTVLENVLLGSLFGTSRDIDESDAKQESLELLEFVGLSAARATPAKDLTLANQKRLEVARGLATNPELFLLDEMMAGLNPSEVAQAMELVTRIRDKGITIFMIEHVMKAIMNVCDRIMVLDHGVKIAEGTPDEITTNKKVVEVYLGE
ncbi:MAG: ABC transporter ATP-binding protein [Deltaproteobacteria bacterium]|nr:MAG: ABC transporter ATP-binding protein [Deltaproteobacteria bacterium]